MASLITLPRDILDKVIGYLPQQDVINLATTNYHFYQPCVKKLYRKITVQSVPILNPRHPSSEDSARYKIDFLDSAETILYGFKSSFISPQNQQKLISARIQSLILALSINSELIGYIEEIEISGAQSMFGDSVYSDLNQLFEVVCGVPNNVSKFYISDYNVRRKLGYRSWKRKLDKLTSVTIDNISEFHDLRGIETELLVSLQDHSTSTTLPASTQLYDFSKLVDLQHLLIINHAQLYHFAITYFTQAFRQYPFKFTLKSFNLYHTHEYKLQEKLYPFIDLRQIQCLQMSLGCNDSQDCRQSCIEEAMCTMDTFDHVRQLAFIQNTDIEHNNHAYNEKWDIIVFNYIKSVIDQDKDLVTLSIRHNPANDGVVNDGYEGNYLRRIQLYGHFLPNFLSNQPGKINVFLPNLVKSLSVYEPAMNTLMWNGCKCKHCLRYLGLLDEFLIYHKYYNFKSHTYKDLITANLISVIADQLAQRMTYDELVGDMKIHAKPLKNVYWNFHTNKFSIPFKCLNYKSYEEADFEDDKDPHDEELYFDAESEPNDCKFFQPSEISFYKDVTTCISHYLNDLVLKMINLNRGNAEDVQIGGIEDENDGAVNFQMNKLSINGIVFNFDKELNGTAFFNNVYDDV